MNNRMEEIRKKGFAMKFSDQDTHNNFHTSTDFSKIQVGAKTLDDAIIDVGTFKKLDARLGNKNEVLKAINNGDLFMLRDISNFYFKTSGIYSRLCKYMAYMYKYDWIVTPYIDDNASTNKVLKTFNDVLLYLDNFEIKKFCGEVALKVLRNGCYYGYIIEQKDTAVIQELPANYCRSRFKAGNRPAIEFNMKWFDDRFKDTNQKMRVLQAFPEEFAQAYILYKQGKLPADFAGDTAGWYLLDTTKAIKFNLYENDYPAFVSVIPAILDLDNAQELDRKRMAQKLLRLVIQTMPIDKNGDLVFDIDEAQQLHNNAVRMLSKSIGIDVLTTFADVSVEDLSDNSTTTSVDELEKVERTVYNEAGVSQLQFNSDGSAALKYSINNDEAVMTSLIGQFEQFFNFLIKKFNDRSKKVSFRFQILPTTIYNYQEVAKLYKEQTQLGYSKMMPQVALGQSQSAILATAYFENDVLDLVHKLIPPMSSNTMNAEALAESGGSSSNDSSSSSGDEGGRPTKESQGETVSEKTIQNQESEK